MKTMQRNSTNLRKYKEVCAKKIEDCNNLCEVCGAYIYEPGYINFAHTATRNGKPDEWVLDPENIIFCCAEHHIQEEQTGIRIKRKTNT